MIEILKKSTGYKRLDVYILMNVIQLETLVFCRRFLDWKTEDPCGRQFDQMTQAARSGVKNLTEGSEREATSAQNTLKLLDVAKASLCELRDDYMTWLLDRDLPPWRQSSPEAQEVYKVLLDQAEYGDDINYDVAVRIIATRRKFAKWFGEKGQSTAVECKRLQSNRRQSTAIECWRRLRQRDADSDRAFAAHAGQPDVAARRGVPPGGRVLRAHDRRKGRGEARGAAGR